MHDMPVVRANTPVVCGENNSVGHVVCPRSMLSLCEVKEMEGMA